MNFYQHNISGVKLIELTSHIDQRGSLTRFFCQEQLSNQEIVFDVKQCNLSINKESSTLRGFHYQKEPFSEQKLLSCIKGKIYDVVVDLRPTSTSYLRWESFELDATSKNCLYIPAGCANAFLTLEEETQIFYWHSAFFNAESYTGFRYNDPLFNIDWPETPSIISDKDASYPNFAVN